MPNKDYPLTQEEFDFIYSKVPRLTVEILLKNKNDEVYLTLRASEPCKGQWHLPGGTVRFGETLEDAVTRIASRELGIEVKKIVNKGYIEYPSHYLNGLDSPFSIVFEVTQFRGEPVINNKEATEGAWFKRAPKPLHADQDIFLKSKGYLS